MLQIITLENYELAFPADIGRKYNMAAPVRSISDMRDNPKTINRSGVYIYNVTNVTPEVQWRMWQMLPQRNYEECDKCYPGGTMKNVTNVTPDELWRMWQMLPQRNYEECDKCYPEGTTKNATNVTPEELWRMWQMLPRRNYEECDKCYPAMIFKFSNNCSYD